MEVVFSVCTSLFLHVVDALPVYFGDFGLGEGLVLLSEVRCSGREESLDLCPQDVLTDNFCTHFQDAGVICFGE